MTVYGVIKKFYNKRSAALIPPPQRADTDFFQLSAALAARLFAAHLRRGGFPLPIAAEFSKKVLPALAFYVQICYNFCNGVLL